MKDNKGDELLKCAQRFVVASMDVWWTMSRLDLAGMVLNVR